MKHLIIGSEGQVGYSLSYLLRYEDLDCVSRETLDITKSYNVSTCIETSKPDLADTCIRLVDYFENTGEPFKHIINVVGPEPCSKYHWAKIIAEECDCNPDLVRQITSNFLDRPAKRPTNGILDTSKLEGIFEKNPIRGTRDGIKCMNTTLNIIDQS